MKVAFVTPELQTLVQRTNLAAVAEALARAMRREGADTRVFLPWSTDLKREALTELAHVASLPVADGRGPDGARPPVTLQVYRAALADLPVYLIDHSELFRSRAPYSDSSGPYPDNWRRYALFARAVLECLPEIEFEPDVIHCVDWTTGLLPLIHQVDYVARELDHPAARAGTYFAIHNLAMQGTFEREILPLIGVPHTYFRHVAGVELHGKVNFLKAGAEFATIIGTHSPSHAQKLQQVDRGYGLEETFRRRSKELVGITNGIDYQAWDPSNDPVLPASFSARDRDMNGKKKAKALLQGKLGLDSGPRTPLAACIGRWDADGGVDLLVEILTPALERGIELVVMGAGSAEVQQRLKTLESTFLGRFKVIEGYHVGTAHLLMGAADILLLPFHYQPSNSLFAIGMRYGVLPIVYAKSGLEDVVIDVHASQRYGLGFHFDPYTGDGLLSGIDAALKMYKNPTLWKQIARRCMVRDYSWSATAQEHLKAYRRVTRRSKARLEAE